MISATVSEEVSQHILLAKTRYEALKTLKDMYDSHSEMEFIQLMLKLFSLEVNDNDPMLVTSEIREIMHKIQAYGMKPYLPLAAFVKSFYPTHSNYLESLQASDKFKYLTFDVLVENIADRERDFGKKTSEITTEYLFFAHKAKNKPKDPFKGDSSKRSKGRRNI